MRCSRGSSALTGWNVSRPTTSSTRGDRRPRRRRAGRAARRVKCSPAVGRGRRAGFAAYTVWYRSGRSSRVVDVRRQRHLAVLGEQRQRLDRADELDVERVAGLRARHRSTITGRPSAVEQLARRRGSLRAGRTSASQWRRPRSSGSSSSTSAAPPVCPLQTQPGRDHLGVVDDHDVAGPQQARQVGDGAVLGRRAPPVDEQPGGVARLDRHLGDALGRQLVVELLQPHRPRRLRTVLPIRVSEGHRSVRGRVFRPPTLE